MEISVEMILSLAGAITVLGGAWLTYRKIVKDNEDEREEREAAILQTAKDEIAKEKAILDAKIGEANSRIDNLENSIEKDLAHIRETYNGEIRNLGQKIEDLRSELRNQHGSLVSLLTKLIDNSDN